MPERRSPMRSPSTRARRRGGHTSPQGGVPDAGKARDLGEMLAFGTLAGFIDADPKLAPPDAAKYLGVKPSTLADWRSAKRGPDYIKLGAAVRYRRSALDRFLDANTVRTNEPLLVGVGA
jgi:hypothetical protein